jgi:hypothetical protein
VHKLALAALGTSAIAFAAPAHADMTGIEQFVGSWVGMKQALFIDGGGNGHFTYPDFNACPGCAPAAVRRSVATFVLTNVWGNTANGNILTDTGQGGNAGPISATLIPQPYGPTIQLNAGPASGVYCTPPAAKNCGP